MPEVEEEVREIHRVPGEWRCLQCGIRVSTPPDVIDRPPCPNNCAKLLVPMSWKRYGPEQEAKIAALAPAGEVVGQLEAWKSEAQVWREKYADALSEMAKQSDLLEQQRLAIQSRLDEQQAALDKATAIQNGMAENLDKVIARWKAACLVAGAFAVSGWIATAVGVWATK